MLFFQPVWLVSDLVSYLREIFSLFQTVMLPQQENCPGIEEGDENYNSPHNRMSREHLNHDGATHNVHDDGSRQNNQQRYVVTIKEEGFRAGNHLCGTHNILSLNHW
jgi:hypothetical protein